MFLMAVILFSLPSHIYSQGNVIEREKPSQYVEVTEEKPKPTFFQGFSISADLFPISPSEAYIPWVVVMKLLLMINH